jgi:hypothetical protein
MNILIKVVLPIIVLFASCSLQKKVADSIVDVYYEAETRGSFISIHFKGNAVAFKSVSADKLIDLSKIEVNDTKRIISKIKLSKIPHLIAPSNKRFYDGALIGRFTIKKNNSSYVSSDFDHGNPPKELLALYKIVQKFIP